MVDGDSTVKTKADAIKSLARLRALLASVEGATCQVNLVKSTINPSVKNTRYVDMTERLANSFKQEAAANLRKIIDDSTSDADGVSEFNHQAFADGRIAFLPVSQFPEVKSWFDKLPYHDRVEPLTREGTHVSQLKFTTTILVFSPKGETIRIFRKASESRLAKKGVIASLIGGTQFEYVDANAALIFDMISDFFVWEDSIFVANYRSLESILNFRDITTTIAQGVCDKIFEALPVVAAAKLQAVILSGPRQINKIASLNTKPHITKMDMTMIQAVIEKAKLPLKIIDVNGADTLEVDASNSLHVKAFLHILSDDYVRSMMTEIDYIAGGDKEVLS